MSCCEKEKYDRLRVFSHANVLACQMANSEPPIDSAIEISSGRYGEYYAVIELSKAVNPILTYKSGEELKKKPYKVAKVL